MEWWRAENATDDTENGAGDQYSSVRVTLILEQPIGGRLTYASISVLTITHAQLSLVVSDAGPTFF
jgi:hypothetical protein